MLVTIITESRFFSELRGSFSPKSLDALWDYFDEETATEFDPVEMISEIKELSYSQIASDYDLSENGKEYILHFLEDNTSVIFHDDEKVLFTTF
jgi:hypothetical protein